MGGGKGGAKAPKATKYQAKFAQGLLQDTDPIRQSLFTRSNDFLSGGFDPRSTPTYGAVKYSADSNFNQAKDNVLQRFGRGGPLVSAMTGLEEARAGGLTQAAGSIYGDELNRAMTLGTGMAQLGSGSLGQAGSVQAQMAQANAASSAAGKGALGTAAGMYFGGEGFAKMK